MIIVTGGAGFIGSNVVAGLAAAGEEVVVCDWMAQDQRWRNLAKHEIASLVTPPALLDWLDERRDGIAAVVHMGANSKTTETDVEQLAEYNIRATLNLLDWCAQTGTRFIYASSAATYGDGSAGFDDEFTPAALAALRPLNAYGWSKHVVDRLIARRFEQRKALPPQVVGLKFFNVYGPNEYHKGGMQSIVAAHTARLLAGEPLSLFRSYRPDYRDGGQLRDFVYVKDCVDVILWLLQNPEANGLFNVGTGKARSWLDLANAVFAAIDRAPAVKFVDMPPQLIDRYQYFTEARIDRLRAAGYHKAFTTLEAGVSDYVREYLVRDDPYL
jgi:ADP-L-glycero-D-manno-heptose 6-epimerase